VARGQHEIDFRFAMPSRQLTHSDAEVRGQGHRQSHGLVASFMPEAGVRNQRFRHALPPINLRCKGTNLFF